jgi:hypothetical protein
MNWKGCDPLKLALAALTQTALATLVAAKPAFAAPSLVLTCWSNFPGSSQPPLDLSIVVDPDQNLLTKDTGTGPERMELQQFSQTMITANDDDIWLLYINRLTGTLYYTVKGLAPKMTEYYGRCRRAVSEPAF